MDIEEQQIGSIRICLLKICLGVVSRNTAWGLKWIYTSFLRIQIEVYQSSMRLAFWNGHSIACISILRRAYRPVIGPFRLPNQGLKPSFHPQLQRSVSGKAAPPSTAPRENTSHSNGFTYGLGERLESNGTARAASTNEKFIIGIDPDNGGAVAVISIPEENTGVLEHLSQTDVEIHDMPLEEISVGKRIRRQTNSIAAARIIKKLTVDAPNSAELWAVLEEPVPNPVNGLLSVLGTGFAFGVWKGVLASHEVRLETVSARRWKADLGLNKAGKEGSRHLALQLFPEAAGLLKRKKDHGRAEALLIVAWALGLRALKPRPEEPGDIIITESDGSIPGSTIIADSTLRDALHEGEGPVSSA